MTQTDEWKRDRGEEIDDCKKTERRRWRWWRWVAIRCLDEAALSTPRAGDVVNVVAESNKEVKEELAASIEHLGLHGAAALEGIAAADDESEEVCTELGVVVGSVCVSVASRQENGVACNAGA